MTLWLLAITLIAAGLAWLESRRPNRANIVSRILAVLLAVGAIIVLLITRGNSGRVTLLTPGAPLAAHSREAVSLEQVQSLASLAAREPVVRLAGWGLLPHEWPEQPPEIAGFERADLPAGITALEAPTETGVGELMSVRGSVTLPPDQTAWVILEDPAAARDSAQVTASSPAFSLGDRPKAPGPVSYRLRLRVATGLEVAETLAVAVRRVSLPSVLILDASPSFETVYLKHWLGERGGRVTIRTAISRGIYRTERLNAASGTVELLNDGVLSQYQAVLADGGSIAALSPSECAALDRAIRLRGLGLLVTADAPWLAARANCGVTRGFTLETITSSLASLTGDRGDRRVARPVVRDGPRRSRTGIEVEAAFLRPTGIEPIVTDEVGRVAAGWRRVGTGRIGMTLLRAPSRWVLEGEPDLFAAYWHALLQAVARDTTTRVLVGADGPLRADHPVLLTLETAGPQGTTPAATIWSPDGAADPVPLGQDPFDPTRWTGRYWPRKSGWHRLELQGGRSIPFRVSAPSEWVGLEASARLAATAARVTRAAPAFRGGRLAQSLIGPVAFGVLLLALSWLWIESRLTGRA